MGTQAIVYTSHTGHTAAYAKLLGQQLHLPVYELSEAGRQLREQTEILYFGWLMASVVKGYRKAAKRYRIAAVCGVGLGDTGTQLETVRQGNGLSSDLPLFTLQGGIRRDKLRGLYRMMIGVLQKGLFGKKIRSAGEERMLHLLNENKDHVSIENLSAVVAWYEKEKP